MPLESKGLRRAVAVSAGRTKVPGLTGTLSAMRYDWDDRSVVVLEIESGSGPNRDHQSVRIPAGQADKYALGQKLKIETQLVEGA